jgi:hypothetical protein
MIVDVKLNNLTWLLTGRSSGFVYPLLNTNVAVPMVDDKRVQRARKLLRLDLPGTDFFVYGALASIYSSLYYARYLDVDHQAAFVPGLIPITYSSKHVYEFENNELVYLGGVPKPIDYSNEWNILPYYDENSLSVVRNVFDWDEPYDAIRLEKITGGVTATKYWLGTPGKSTFVSTVTDSDDSIAVDLTGFAGLRARFDAKNKAPLTFVNAQPVHYPYVEVAARVVEDSSLISLMSDMGTLPAFYEATSGITSVGAVAAAIVLKSRTYGTGPTYEVSMNTNRTPGVPTELDVPVSLGNVKLETSCNE